MMIHWVPNALYQPQSFLDLEILSVLPYMGMAAILLNGVEPFE